MAKRRRRRYCSKNRVGKREGIVRPNPMAERKKRPWPMQELLRLGPEAGGIDSQEFEAALQIAAAFQALTHEAGMAQRDLDHQHIRGGRSAPREMTDREADLAATWLAWADRLPVRAAHIAEAITDARPITPVAELRAACRLWAQVSDERARARRAAQRQPQAVAAE